MYDGFNVSRNIEHRITRENGSSCRYINHNRVLLKKVLVSFINTRRYTLL